MNIHQLPGIKSKRKKRLGQGHGSGRGKTAGRGTKGQNARGKMPLSFEGGALPLIKRLPFLRGKGKNAAIGGKQAVVNIQDLAKLSRNSKVTEDLLIEKQLVHKDAKRSGVKILGKGTLDFPLVVKVAASKNAREKIEKAGGTIEL